jgi:two-component system KDP operon response regulator KdpE
VTSVLVVDDDPAIQRTLAIGLRARGYDVLPARDGRTAVEACHDDEPDVVLLDLGLPDLSGVEVLRTIRGWSQVPVIVLSARHGSDDKVEALDVGADDYVTKPFGMEELLARLRTTVRRSGTAQAPETVQTDAFRIDLGAKRVWRDGVEVRLTPTEWGSSRHSSPGRGAWCHNDSSCTRCGARRTARRRTTSGSTWPTSAASSSPIPPVRATSSPSPAWATAS